MTHTGMLAWQRMQAHGGITRGSNTTQRLGMHLKKRYILSRMERHDALVIFFSPVEARRMRRSCAYIWRNDVASGQAGLLLRGGCVRDVGHDPMNKFTEERLLEENFVGCNSTGSRL